MLIHYTQTHTHTIDGDRESMYKKESSVKYKKKISSWRPIHFCNMFWILNVWKLY